VQRRVGRSSRAVSGLAATALLAGGVLLAACDSSSSSGATPTSPPSSSPTSVPTHLSRETLTFGVVGPQDEVDAYRQMASLFAPLNRRVTVRVESWPNETAMMDDLRAGAKPPDVFIASRRDLLWLNQQQLIQPIDQLLDDRGVDFGDDYPRGTLTSFGLDNRLDCLPYGVEPSVIYYNKRLVKLAQVTPDPPAPGQGWSLDQFAATARWAVSRHPHAAGAYVDPTIAGVSPFVLSGGGRVFDSANPPTTLTLSSDASQQALIRTVRVLHRPGVSLTPEQLDEKTPLEWFESGRLAMLEDSRHIVPELRNRLGFEFDVMPMPDLGTPATVGDLTGLCISNQAADASTAADFLVYASSPDALGYVASQGYLQPANQAVALSDDFQQPGRLPQHASVFTFSVKSMQFPPLIAQWDALDAWTEPTLKRMLHGRASQVPPRTREIDQASRKVLHVEPSGSPSSSPSSSPSGSSQPSG
jgi:multiple sugar transport system substrate-binding protein